MLLSSVWLYWWNWWFACLSLYRSFLDFIDAPWWQYCVVANVFYSSFSYGVYIFNVKLLCVFIIIAKKNFSFIYFFIVTTDMALSHLNLLRPVLCRFLPSVVRTPLVTSSRVPSLPHASCPALLPNYVRHYATKKSKGECSTTATYPSQNHYKERPA